MEVWEGALGSIRQWVEVGERAVQEEEWGKRKEKTVEQSKEDRPRLGKTGFLHHQCRKSRSRLLVRIHLDYTLWINLQTSNCTRSKVARDMKAVATPL